MPRTLNALTVLLLCAFLVLPLGLLAGLGAVAPYGQKNFTPFPEPKKLLHSSPTERKGLGSALFERSPATVFAIRTHNAALYRVTGTIDNDKMVSGQGDWLFLKEQFWDGKCLSDDVFATTLRAIDTMAAMAAAAGLPILFTVSPDKTSIHPEKLGARAAFYAGCKTQNGKRWRELAPRYAPQLLDHTAAILDPGNPKVPYFFATDTHWNSRAMALAVRQLASTLGSPSTPVLYAGEPYARDTDLRNRMLLLSGPEADEGVTAFLTPREDTKPLLFIQDSFYGVAHEELAKAFPNSKFYDFENDAEAYAEALQHYSGQVVVNTVERALFRRFGNWDGALAGAIVDRNMARAQSCVFTQPVDIDTSATLENVERTGPSSFEATTDDPDIIVPIPAQSNCVRIALEVDRHNLFQLFLPVLQGRDDEEDFSEGRSIMVSLPAGKSVLNFVLPANRVGTTLRIDPTTTPGPFTLSEISFGNLP